MDNPPDGVGRYRGVLVRCVGARDPDRARRVAGGRTVSRYAVTSIEGYLSEAVTSRQAGVSYMVVDTLWNRRVVATFRSEDYLAQGRLWARLGAEGECKIRNAALGREDVQAASGTAS